MLNLRTGSRGFSSGSGFGFGFGFRGRRARNSDTLGTLPLLVYMLFRSRTFPIYAYSFILIIHTHFFFFFFFDFQQLYFIYYYFFNEDVEVNELEDLHRRSHEAKGQYYCCCWFIGLLIISAKIKSWNYLYLLYWLQFWCYSLRKPESSRIC